MPHSHRSLDRPRIAVAGATGRVGSALLASLTGDPVDVVALSRDGGDGRLPSDTAMAVVDFDRPSTLVEALRETDRLFLAHGTSDRQVANETAMIDAAVAAGVSHIVKLSAMGPPTRLHPFDWHMRIEAHLATKDVGYTVLRPGSFVTRLAGAAIPIAGGTWGGAAGDGRVNLIDTRDVAEVARIALLDDRSPSSQRAYHLTGPGAVSMPEVAGTLSRLLGRPVEYIHRSVTHHRKLLIESGVSEMVADLALGLDRLFNESVMAEVTATCSDLTGKPPRSVEEWLRDNLGLFQKRDESGSR
jgi:NAD(P)H dehydrogenase (quinone)